MSRIKMILAKLHRTAYCVKCHTLPSHQFPVTAFYYHSNHLFFIDFTITSKYNTQNPDYRILNTEYWIVKLLSYKEKILNNDCRVPSVFCRFYRLPFTDFRFCGVMNFYLIIIAHAVHACMFIRYQYKQMKTE